MISAILFLPLSAAVIVGLFSRRIGARVALFVTCLFMLIASALSINLFIDVLHGAQFTVIIGQWMVVETLSIDWAIHIDMLSAVMICVVCIVSTLVHIYSAGYMRGDSSIPRFMAYLSLFTFSMLALVCADNFVQMFFGWEGVGLCSYLLIGYWHHKESAAHAGVKAFLVNRIGDIGFVLAMCAIYAKFGTLSFSPVFDAVPSVLGESFVFLGWQFEAITTIALLLFVGAMGKSAQLGLHVWLPDAMEGPTPVSALIHAATMVTAGVFMLCRLSPLIEYSEFALGVITIVGAATAFFAASVALAQNDIKRVIAYSTCSQLGYMVFAVGLSAYGAAMFHLTTHAFFKALLFLSAGSLIHAVSGEQDMRKMGGLRSMIPLTYLLFWIGAFALAGIPLLAGFYSKDIILESAWAAHTIYGQFAFALGNAAALMTALYAVRMIILSFHGKPRFNEHVMKHVHEAPAVMTFPLLCLAIGAIVSGLLLESWFVGESMDTFWRGALFTEDYHTALRDAHHSPRWVKALPLFLSVFGIGLALLCYQGFPSIPKQLSRSLRPLYRFLEKMWYFDDLYRFVFVRFAFFCGKQFWQTGDRRIIDGGGPDGLSALAQICAARIKTLQSGYVYHYAFAMLLGVILFGAYVFVRYL